MAHRKAFLKIPDSIIEKVARIKPKPVVVGCLKRVTASALKNAEYAHLGISLVTGQPKFPASIVPRPENGRFSERNANGYEIVHRELPKVTRTFSVETPNFGDWSRGSHDVDFVREVYQRESIPPRENEIAIELLGREAVPEETFAFRFTVSEVMDSTGDELDSVLLFNLNLLQENIGSADVFPSDATVNDYLRTVYINWEILPPGEREQNIATILRNVGDTPAIRERVRERYDFFEKLNPQAFIQGHGGFKGYFGAKFSDHLVVFENMQYGNAIYLMFSDWVAQSQRTKQELLASGGEGTIFMRIRHATAWKANVKRIIRDRLRREKA